MVIELIKDLTRLLNQSCLSTLTFQLIYLYLKLRRAKKGLINIKNKDQKKKTYGVMLGILILQKNIQKELEKLIKKKLVKYITNPEEITKEDKEFISDLDYDEIGFPV